MNNELFIINQVALLEDMSKIDRFVKERSFIPYSDHVLIESNGKEITYSVLDIENIFKAPLRGVSKIHKPFKICIENSFILTLTAREVDITFILFEDKQICQLLSPNGKVEVPIISAKDFPHLQNEGEIIFSIEELKLHEALKTIIPFTFADSISSNNSVHFFYTEKTLRIGARDNYSACATSLSLECKEDINFMLSRKSCQMITSMTSNLNNSLVRIKQHKNDIIIESVNGTLACRMMIYSDMTKANDFYRLMMPFAAREGDIIEIQDKKEMLEQIHKSIVFSTNEKIIFINLNKDKLIFEVENSLVGKKSIQELFVIFKHKGKTLQFIANSQYLTKLIRSIDSETFKINIPLSSKNENGYIDQPMCIENNGFIYIMGPLVN